jgi:hypothetical protein
MPHSGQKESMERPISAEDMSAWAQAINQVLSRFSEKDWNYSRISLKLLKLNEINSPYALAVDWLDVGGKIGKNAYKNCQNEVTWGGRHSHELGILELISLRINKALSEVSSDDFWHGVRPVLRLQKKAQLEKLGQSHGFWYQVEEVEGEEFENR